MATFTVGYWMQIIGTDNGDKRGIIFICIIFTIYCYYIIIINIQCTAEIAATA